MTFLAFQSDNEPNRENLANREIEAMANLSLKKHPNELKGPGDSNLSLDPVMDYDQIFSLVKKTVKSATGRERSGLGLALADLPPTLGAFWQVGGNYIVMNENLVYAMMRLSRSSREFNSFIYMILTHEYLHSCGFIDESEARRMTALVAEKAFGNDHPASKMSSNDLWRLYPEILNVSGGNGSSFRIVSKFDSDSTSYIG
jgi:hypothetical protein